MIIDIQTHHFLGRETLKSPKPVEPLMCLAKQAGVTRMNLLGNLFRTGKIRPPARDVKAIRLYPNYHRYGLDDPMVNEVVKTAIKLKLPVMVAVRVEDERQQYPLMQIPGVPLAAIAKFAAAHPRARVIALNGYFHEIIAVEDRRNLYFDIAFAELTDTLRALTEYMPARQLLFGSQTPFLTTKAAAMKVDLANISQGNCERIAEGNAVSLFRLDR
jgi:predicted TIM-barrel fold metal-dependent hydrolase